MAAAVAADAGVLTGHAPPAPPPQAEKRALEALAQEMPRLRARHTALQARRVRARRPALWRWCKLPLPWAWARLLQRLPQGLPISTG